MKKINIGFIGSGNMGFAIMKGIVSCESGLENIQLYAFDTNPDQLAKLNGLGVISCSSSNEIVEKCKYVFLAVKPQVFDVVLENIASDIKEDTVIISIAAGISSEYIQSKTIKNAKVILVMPNTPLLVNEGASALSHNELVSENEFEIVYNIFATCGKAEVISKDKMKEIIAINSSSPAFIYLFAKGFINYAESQGIDKDVAKRLFSQTLIGSAKMITDSGDEIDELIKKVSSPGGTTLAGLDGFYEGNLLGVIEDSCNRCTKRAYELSKK